MLEGSTAQSTGASGRRRTVQPALEGEKRDGALVLRASGDWLARTVGSLEGTVAETAGAELGRTVVVDCAGVERIDTAGAFVLEKMTRDIAASDRDVRIEGVEARDEALFVAVRQAMDRERPQPTKQRANRLVKVLAGTGGGVIAMKDEIVFALNIIGGSSVPAAA